MAEGGDSRTKGRGRRHVGPDVQLSKTLSWLLRHGAEKEGFTFIKGGFLYVDDALQIKQLVKFTESDVRRVVENNEKQRFALGTDDNGRLMIRANQGHSVEVKDLDLTLVQDASELPEAIHGTSNKAWEVIKAEGLSRMGRTHIHFAPGMPGADGVISGMRKSCSVIIRLDTRKVMEDGITFVRSSNNVILSPGNADGLIGPQYFLQVLDRKTGRSLI